MQERLRQFLKPGPFLRFGGANYPTDIRDQPLNLFFGFYTGISVRRRLSHADIVAQREPNRDSRNSSWLENNASLFKQAYSRSLTCQAYSVGKGEPKQLTSRFENAKINTLRLRRCASFYRARVRRRQARPCG
jgi:hypothetical protein